MQTCQNCRAKISIDMNFCYKCGHKIKTTAIEKRTKLSSKGTLLERFAHSVSNFLGDGEERSEQDDDYPYPKKEFKKDVYSLLLNKYFLVAVIFILILMIVGVFYLILGEGSKTGTASFYKRPVLRYNSITQDAYLIVRDEMFIRHNDIYGDYVDLLQAVEKGNDYPSHEIMKKAFLNVSYDIDVLVESDLPNYEEQPYVVEIRTPLPLKKLEEKGYWITDKFKVDPISKARFIVSYGADEEFPYGGMDIIFISSDNTV